jgi:hypothetical protein
VRCRRRSRRTHNKLRGRSATGRWRCSWLCGRKSVPHLLRCGYWRRWISNRPGLHRWWIYDQRTVLKILRGSVVQGQTATRAELRRACHFRKAARATRHHIRRDRLSNGPVRFSHVLWCWRCHILLRIILQVLKYELQVGLRAIGVNGTLHRRLRWLHRRG